MAKTKEEKREAARKAIKKSMLEQLEKKGLKKIKYIENLVEDYLKLYDVKNRLIDDIDERGVTVTYQNGKDQIGQKRNDSVSELNKTNQQMLKILAEIGISASAIASADEDDEEL